MKVFIIILKGANTAFLPCYGNNWVPMPNLNVISAQSLVLDNYYCSSYDESEIRDIWLKGDFLKPYPLNPDSKNWLQSLKTMEWITSFIGDQNYSPSTNFSSNFTHVKLLNNASGQPLSYHRAMLDSEGFSDRNKNSLTWIEVSSLLPPWKAGEEFIGPIQEELEDYFLSQENILEDEELPQPIIDPNPDFKPTDDKSYLALSAGCASAWTAVDDMLGAVVASVEEQYGKEEFAIIITADRGSGTCQHDILGTNPDWLYREFTHLPFLLYHPSSGCNGSRKMGFFQDVDLAPTIANICGVALEEYPGESIFKPGFLEEGAREFAYSYDPRNNLKGFRTLQRSLLIKPVETKKMDPMVKYFIFPDDVSEMNDISKTEEHYQEKILQAVSLIEKEGMQAKEKIAAILND